MNNRKDTRKSFIRFRSREMARINPKGTKFTNTHKRRIGDAVRQSSADRKNSVVVIHRPEIIQKEETKYFDTASEAARYIGCSKQMIAQCLNPNTHNKTAYGWEISLEEKND